jgi:hypothetical protein
MALVNQIAVSSSAVFWYRAIQIVNLRGMRNKLTSTLIIIIIIIIIKYNFPPHSSGLVNYRRIECCIALLRGHGHLK